MIIVLLGPWRGDLCGWEVLVLMGTKMFTRFLHGVEGNVHELIFIRFLENSMLVLVSMNTHMVEWHAINIMECYVIDF
jgi:hypothetical protein